MDSPLKNIRVLDLSQFLSGPRCTQILADLGAEVIKVEPPMGETMRLLTLLAPGMERLLSVFHRNKKGITLNLKTEKGKEIFRRLTEKSDVLVENFSRGTMEEMGLGYESLRALNPRLIYASISGFGRTGPLNFRPAFDIISQATSGIMDALRQPDKPPGVFFGDLVSGAFCAIGVFFALMARERSGQGQLVDISMQDVMYFHNYRSFSKKAVEPALDDIQRTFGRSLDMFTDEKNRMPFWNSYKTQDGYIAIVALTDSQWTRLADVIGRPELKDKEKFGNLVLRVRNAPPALKIVEEWAARHTVGEIEETLDRADVPCGRVHDIDSANRDRQLEARGMYEKVLHPSYGEIGVLGIPFRFSETTTHVSSPAPGLGQHTVEVLTSLLGMTEEEVKKLKDEEIL